MMKKAEVAKLPKVTMTKVRTDIPPSRMPDACYGWVAVVDGSGKVIMYGNPRVRQVVNILSANANGDRHLAQIVRDSEV